MRIDGARNRQVVLAAAGDLLDRAADPDRISMDDIAAAAGVGKGTLFRGFGDRAGLIRALYAERSKELHAILDGLGPDRPERVVEALTAMLDFKLANSALTRALEKDGAESIYQSELYGLWHERLTSIIAAVRGPQDADYLAHTLLAAVRSDLLHQLRDWPRPRLQAGLSALVLAILADQGRAGSTGV